MSDRQLLKYLRMAPKPAAGDKGQTTSELALLIHGRITPSTRGRIQARIRDEVQSGRVVAGRGMRQNSAGAWHGEPVYRVVSKK